MQIKKIRLLLFSSYVFIARSFFFSKYFLLEFYNLNSFLKLQRAPENQGEKWKNKFSKGLLAQPYFIVGRCYSCPSITPSLFFPFQNANKKNNAITYFTLCFLRVLFIFLSKIFFAWII